jgi:inorganic triphosphatase YgiF
MSDPLEIELKLEMAPEDRARLDASSLFAQSDGRTDRLVSTYFDTPDLDLHAAGYSLRVRRAGSRRVQTVKAEGDAAAGLFVRGEWEREIDGDHPVLDAASGPLSLLVDEEALVGIARLFETDVKRTRHMLAVGESAVELAVDEGRLRAGNASEPLCELELELEHGEPQVLFDLARRLNEEVPLRLGVRSKSERGYRLVGGEAPASVKAEPVRLDPEADVREIFAVIARACMRQFRLNETLLVAMGGVEALHQARVGLRRLRSAFSLFKPLFAGDDRATWLRAELRWLAAELGEVRNLDVLVERTEGDLQARLGAARAEQFDRLLTELASARTRLMMIDLAEWLLIGDWRTKPADEALACRNGAMWAADTLERHRRRLKHRGKGLAKLDDAERHEVRIEAKKLRYATEFFASLFPGKKARRRRKAFLSALESLQDDLGLLNDHVTGPEVLRQLGLDPKLAPPPVGHRHRLLRHAEEGHEALMDAKRFWR